MAAVWESVCGMYISSSSEDAAPTWKAWLTFLTDQYTKDGSTLEQAQHLMHANVVT